jgi:p24 family protein beta-1
MCLLICVPPADVVAPVEREIRSLANGLTAVKDEQEYIVVREKIHRNTAESTNTRVKWWSILQAVVLFAVVGWQIMYLKVRCQVL